MTIETKPLPAIKGSYADFSGLYGRDEFLELLNHDSMGIYYDVEVSDDGDAFSISELPTTLSRSAMMRPVIKQAIDDFGPDATVIDLACSPGYFMFQASDLGAKSVVGVDVRSEHQKQFDLLNRFYNKPNVSFIKDDLYMFLQDEIARGQKYDVCLLFGFLYHTSTPVELLENISRICKGRLIVETTISQKNDNSISIYEEATAWSRASSATISMMPSLRSVPSLLRASGYSDVRRIVPSLDLRDHYPAGPHLDYFFDVAGPTRLNGNGASATTAGEDQALPERRSRRVIFSAEAGGTAQTGLVTAKAAAVSARAAGVSVPNAQPTTAAGSASARAQKKAPKRPPGAGVQTRIKRIVRSGLRTTTDRSDLNPYDPGLQTGRQLFFVTGRSKSGTTWMGRLLGSHPHLYCDVSENSAFHQDFDFSYFGASTKSMNQKVGNFFESRTRKLLKNGLITNLLYGCKKRSAIRFGDKTPRQDLARIFEAFPETQVIVMLRDFRDVAVSLAFHRARSMGTWEGVFTDEDKTNLDSKYLQSHLESYLKHHDIEEYLKIAARKPDNVKLVKYEDLKERPEDILTEILSFMQVNDGKAVVAKCIKANTFEKLSGGRKPGESESQSFYRKGVVGDWRNYFSQENVDLFKRLAADTLIAAEYETSQDWGL